MTYRPHYEHLTEPVSVGCAEQPGAYPPDGEAVTIAGIELGPGSTRFLRQYDGTVTDVPLGWSTNEPIDHPYETWLALVRVFSATGLWPVIGSLGYGTTRPWAQHHHWRREPLPERPNTIERVLAEAWDGQAWCDSRTGQRLPETRSSSRGRNASARTWWQPTNS